MFKKILIANRGAIACRIIRTLKSMNIASVAIYADADIDSLHVEQADEAYSLGEGAASSTYLDQDKIIEIAKSCDAEAIHPGYGFLSENPTFVERCNESGITFIGPTTDNMKVFALKHTARDLAEKHHVPLVPGTGLLSDVGSAVKAAEKIGYPIILKSSAGGGGIGMQICRCPEALENAFDSVVRLSENNFSDGSVFLEKYIEHARHIEVQVFGNGLGKAIDLGERDCSLQRRNQKVIEEAPAPNLSDNIRHELHETAIRLLSGVHYANAGTVEFIYDTLEHKFYFLEVNTRLQVEHGVTEEVFNVDLVRWMIEQAFSPIRDLEKRREQLTPNGHAIQARIYAENPALDFRPSAGLLSRVEWPSADNTKQEKLRIDSWVRSGIEVSPYFDPMIAKVIVHSSDRASSIQSLRENLNRSELYGIETNLEYSQSLLSDDVFIDGDMTTRYLNTREFSPCAIEVLSPGTMTTIQDSPGRTGYWEVGVPPSGPFDNYSFDLGNKTLGNEASCAGLEITVNGPTLKFYSACEVIVTGADIEIMLDQSAQPHSTSINIQPGQTLSLGKIKNKGARSYLLFQNGLRCPDYLGSKSTFTLGQFGGHNGRALRTGDILKFQEQTQDISTKVVDINLSPKIESHWNLHVVYGPHGAPDFFTQKDIDTFFNTDWEVHYNSSRTGIRLIGPKPEWARETGGEAGMHPSNIHDNAYAFGTVDFTGDMPVILGPDGPSLGGFVCPATVINADLWKLGQLRAGDTIKFIPVNIESATAFSANRKEWTDAGAANTLLPVTTSRQCLLEEYKSENLDVIIRPAGDQFLLVEFGEQQLDLRLRFQVHALRDFFQTHIGKGVIDLTPGIRSLQIHFDPLSLPHTQVIALVKEGLDTFEELDDLKIRSRIVHLPLSWDDKACQLAVEKYMQSVRQDAPWCPSNIEFIRRINGLNSVEDVKNIVFSANYVVMGLGDVYLGAPVATPLDPRHRLVTTKYNPARTWTAENSVGIGGAYMCIYGMEGPGGYQFVGRTLQMWNRYRQTEEFSQPWLLRFFDQVKFFPVSERELVKIRQDFPRGHYPIKIEHTEFSLKEYEQFLSENAEDIDSFTEIRTQSFEEELQRWRDSGQFHFESSQDIVEEESELPEGVTVVESSVAGSIWKTMVEPGQDVASGDTILILESMKMEIEIPSPINGKIHSVLKNEGSIVSAGQALIYIEENE